MIYWFSFINLVEEQKVNLALEQQPCTTKYNNPLIIKTNIDIILSIHHNFNYL